jgi:hypothetical protein
VSGENNTFEFFCNQLIRSEFTLQRASTPRFAGVYTLKREL